MEMESTLNYLTVTITTMDYLLGNKIVKQKHNNMNIK